MASTDIEIQIKAIDRATAALNRIEKNLRPMAKNVGKIDKEFKNVDKSIKKSSDSFGKFKGLLAGALTVGGLTQFSKSVIEASGRAEDLKTTLATVTGSAKGAEDAWDFINEFATKTPFDIETLTETFIKLKAAGIEPTEKLLTSFGDMAAVTTDRIGSLTAVTDLFSRTTAGGLGLEELNRLADRGIPVFDIFNEKLGLTRLEISEFGKTAEGAAKLKEALLEGLDERFGGGMEKASENLTTKISNLGIAFNNALIAVGEGGFSDAIGRATDSIQKFILENEDLAKALGEKLGQAVDLVMTGITNLGPAMEKMEPIFQLLATVVGDILWPVMKLLGEIILDIATAIQPLAENLAPLLVSGFEGLANVVTEFIIPAFERMITVVENVITKIQSMIEWVGAGVNKMKEMGGSVKDKIGSGLSAAGESISTFGSNAKQSFWDLYDYTVGNSVIPDMVEGIRSWLGGKLQGIIGSVKSFTEGAKSKFWELYDSVVGNSIIPDMVKEVGQHMDKIPQKMIKPVEMGVQGTRNAFQPLPSNYGSPTANLGGFNFNISNVNASANESTSATEMRRYVEGVATQVAYNVLRQNTQFGGLI